MTQESAMPLYKVLNESRTKGEWKQRGNYIGVPYERVTHFNGTKTNEQDEANAEYTALAVNNFSSVCEALEELYEIAHVWANDKEDEVLIKAKQALNNIK